MEHDAWLQHITGGDSLRATARKIDVSPSTITRQLDRNGKLSAETVIDLARAYGTNPVDALVETGYVYITEQRESGSPATLGYSTNQQILAEMLRRVDPEAVRLFHGDEDTISPNFDNIHQFPTPGVQPDWEDMPRAADDSDDEPEMGDEGYHDGP